MAENVSRTVSGEGHSSGRSGRQQGTRKNQIKPTDMRSKEEEYKRLNDELEAKTANLVQEAEQVMREQEAALSKSRMLDNINTEDFLKELDDDLACHNEDKPVKAPSSAKLSNKDSKTCGSRTRPTSARSKQKDSSKTKTDNDAFLTELEDMSLSERIHHMEQTVSENDNVLEDDILPQTAADIGSEATIRFLKAKLRVMQEEVDRLAGETHKKDEECRTISVKLKEVDEERGRHIRTLTAQQTQIEKYKKLAEDARFKWESAENQLVSLRKEVEQLKRSQKQSASSLNATEVRLNRALEEATRYKEQLQKAKTSSKDASDSEKKRVDQLVADNKRLEKQKNELMAGFKKQLKLIDILKRQKMHIEAAKMLQFSEEEFVKALEWGN